MYGLNGFLVGAMADAVYIFRLRLCLCVKTYSASAILVPIERQFLALLQTSYTCILPRPHTIGDGVLFSTDFFVYFFVSLLARLRQNGWTDLHEIFREVWSDPRDDLITFLANSEKTREATSQHGGGVCCASHHSLLNREMDTFPPFRYAWRFQHSHFIPWKCSWPHLCWI